MTTRAYCGIAPRTLNQRAPFACLRLGWVSNGIRMRVAKCWWLKWTASYICIMLKLRSPFFPWRPIRCHSWAQIGHCLISRLWQLSLEETLSFGTWDDQGSDPIISGISIVKYEFCCSRPIDCKPLHEDRGWAIKFAPNSDVITASVGRPDNMLKVSHTKSNFPLIEAPNKLFGGLCWHYRWPYVAVGCDRKLSFWMIQAK